MASLREQRIQQAMNALQAEGYTPTQAAAVVGNWLAESGLNPTASFGDNNPPTGENLTVGDVIAANPGKDYGIAQYTGQRRKDFISFLKTLPTGIDAYGASLLGALNELDKKGYGKEFKSKKDLEAAVDYGFRKYETPGVVIDGTKAAQDREFSRRYALAKLALSTDPLQETPFKPSYFTFAPDQTPNEAGVAAARMKMTPAVPARESAGMSFTPPLPGAMPDVAGPLTPGYNFSNLFGMGLPDPLAGAQNLFSPVKDYERQPMPQVSPDSMRQFLQDTPPNPGLREIPAAPRATPPWSWPQAQTYDPLSSIGTMLPSAPPASGIPDYGPDWGTPGPGLPAVSTPDYTTGSDGTFQTTAPSTMAPKTTTADPVGAPAASVVPQFTKMVPSYAAVAAAVAAADEKAAKDAASEMDRETARAKALSGLPQDTATASLALPAKPPAAAPPAKPVQKPRLPPLPPPQVVRTVPQPKEAPKDPGTALKDQFGTPQQFMGSGVSAQDFAKGVAAVAAINGNDKAKAYAGQLTSERPGISGVAFDALQNEFAKATSQPQTKGLLGAFGLGVPSQPAIGASNSPSPTQGMYVQGPNGAPTWANYSTDQQNALNNSSGFWGGVQNFFGFGPGANNGWGPSGSMGFGPGTSDLY